MFGNSPIFLLTFCAFHSKIREAEMTSVQPVFSLRISSPDVQLRESSSAFPQVAVD